MSHSTYTLKGLTFDQKSVLLSERKKLYWILQDPFLPSPSEGGFNTTNDETPGKLTELKCYFYQVRPLELGCPFMGFSLTCR